MIALDLGEYCWTAQLHDCRVSGALFIAHYTAQLHSESAAPSPCTECSHDQAV
jgi:hypothetical protein